MQVLMAQVWSLLVFAICVYQLRWPSFSLRILRSSTFPTCELLLTDIALVDNIIGLLVRSKP